jgi:hypothetical protein
MNIPFLQNATFTGLVSTDEHYTSQEWSKAYESSTFLNNLSGNWQSTFTTVQSNSANWNTAYDIATFYSQNSAILVQNTTFTELTSLKASNQLKTGQQYVIDDFELKWINRDSVGTILRSNVTEPLLVLALGPNTISHEAYSTLHPEDIVYYDIDARTSTTWYSGANIPEFKGWIYRRIDRLKNIDICWDWRYITNNCCRYDLDPVPVYSNTTTYSKGNVVKTTANKLYISIQNSNTGNAVTSLTWWRPATPFNNDSIFYYPTTETGASNFLETVFSLTPILSSRLGFPTFAEFITEFGSILYSQGSNIASRPEVKDIRIEGAGANNSYNMVFVTNTTNRTLRSILIGPGSFNNVVFGNNPNGISGNAAVNNIRIGGSFRGNFITNFFQNSIIGDNVQNNIFNMNFNNNIIDNNFQNNTVNRSAGIGDVFQRNIVRTSCTGNFLGNFQNNIIGGSFTNNVILNQQLNNVFGESCSNNILNTTSFNKIGSQFSNNTTGTGFSYNTIENGCTNNTFGTSFTYNTVGNLFANNIIGSNSRSNRLGSEVNGNTIGSNFSFNVVENTLTNNVIGNNFTDNVIRNDFIGNTIQDNFNSVTIGANTGGINFTGATHVYNSYDKQIFLGSNLTPRLSYFNEFDQLVVTDPTL